MPYEFTDRGQQTLVEVKSFMDDFIYPAEEEYDEQLHDGGSNSYPPIMDKLKAAARERGLWNLFIPHLDPGAPGTKLSNHDYAPISEQLGKVPFASESMNSSAPDTGNMEILNLYASERVKERWLAPLLEGEIRSPSPTWPPPMPPTFRCASSATATRTCSTAGSGSARVPSTRVARCSS